MSESTQLLEGLAESCELECKRAQGKDGQGKLPNDFWPTYSAFGNSQGGIVLLGVREKPVGHFGVEGIANPKKVITELFNELSGSHAPAWEQVPTLQRRVAGARGAHLPATGRWSVR